MNTIRVLVEIVLAIALPFAVQKWDRSRLSLSARQRGWNTASWGSALYAFGPLSMLGWFWVTRRGWRRIVYGVVASTLLMAVLLAIDASFG